MHLRPADGLDDDALWKILEPVIRAGETWALPRDWTREEALAHWHAPAHEVWVADRGSPGGTAGARDVVGTYFLRPAQLGAGSHVAHAGYMVRPDAQGTGIAGAMCDHSLVRARERGFAAMQFSFVVASNGRAVDLWRRKGFTVIGRSPGAFLHPTLGPVDALMMRRELHADVPLPSRDGPTIRPIEPRDLDEVRAELRTHWDSLEIWSLGRCHRADALPGFVAEAGGTFAGLVTLNVDPGRWQCEVITLSSRRIVAGTGAALLAAAERHARETGCRRIYLTTTNDNSGAIRFYQRQGWRIAHLHAGIVERVRALVPGIPVTGFDGIPIRDEIELERWLVDPVR